jgi:hypothetical protein
MYAPGLTIDAILGSNFLCDYEMTTDFKERCFTATQNSVMSRHSFTFDLTAEEGDGSQLVLNLDLTVKDFNKTNYRSG